MDAMGVMPGNEDWAVREPPKFKMIGAAFVFGSLSYALLSSLFGSTRINSLPSLFRLKEALIN
jgi:hypothetical protein